MITTIVSTWLMKWQSSKKKQKKKKNLISQFSKWTKWAQEKLIAKSERTTTSVALLFNNKNEWTTSKQVRFRDANSVRPGRPQRLDMTGFKRLFSGLGYTFGSLFFVLVGALVAVVIKFKKKEDVRLQQSQAKRNTHNGPNLKDSFDDDKAKMLTKSTVSYQNE